MTRAEQIEAAARELLLVTDGHDETHEAEMRVIRAADKLRAALVAPPTRAAEEGEHDRLATLICNFTDASEGWSPYDMAEMLEKAGYRRAPAVTQDARDIARRILKLNGPVDGVDWQADMKRWLERIAMEFASALTAHVRAAEERAIERCAKIAEGIWADKDAHPTSLMAECGREVARAIRGQTAAGRVEEGERDLREFIKDVPLPPGYRWGWDAMETFKNSKQIIADAVESGYRRAPAVTQSAMQQAEDILTEFDADMKVPRADELRNKIAALTAAGRGDGGNDALAKLVAFDYTRLGEEAQRMELNRLLEAGREALK